MTIIVNNDAEEPLLNVMSAKTASGTGPSIDFEDATEAAVLLEVTVVSGTNPTLDCVIEESVDQNTWSTLATFMQKTAMGTELMKISGFARFLRVKHTITGTNPSFTFTLKANAKN